MMRTSRQIIENVFEIIKVLLRGKLIAIPVIRIIIGKKGYLEMSINVLLGAISLR